VSSAAAAAEAVARQSYGRLVAIIASRSGDVAAAEDALADAFAAALTDWPRHGVPDSPEAWLVTVSRRRMVDGWRRDGLHEATHASLALLVDEAGEVREGAAFPDERLRLMFACAHPALDESVRTPLMLQAVLGIDVARMAGAFITSPAALAQRLVRAKAKIRDAGIPFEVPGPAELPDRLQDVLDGIYAAFGTGWDGADGGDPQRAGLVEEAILLARAAVELLPREPEPLGLLALLLFCRARHAARRDGSGAYVPLSEQQAADWNRADMAAAEACLARSAAMRRIGPYQLEAAIQSAHSQSLRAVPDRALLTLYDALLSVRPRAGAAVARVAVLARVDGAAAALRAMDGLDARALHEYQPYWAVRAHLLAQTGSAKPASQAYDRAIALSDDPSVREFLARRKAALPVG
jgi:RNA polymerase sigma-70 factor (ECF subfamily)